MGIYKVGQYVQLTTGDDYNGYFGTIAVVYPEEDHEGFEYEVTVSNHPSPYSKIANVPFAERELSLAKKTKRKVV